MKKFLLLMLPMLLAGCDKSVDCNDPSIIEKVRQAVINGFQLTEPQLSLRIFDDRKDSIAITGTNFKGSDGAQQCNYSFKIHPPISAQDEIYNTQPLTVNVSRSDDDQIVTDTPDSIVSKVSSLIQNNNVGENREVAPSEHQKQLMKESAEKERKKTDEAKKMDEVRSASIEKIRSMNDSDYKLTTINDLVFFYSAKKTNNLTDEQYLQYFSPQYTNESDIFKKDEMKESELNRVKAIYNGMKSKDGLSVMYPISYIGISFPNFFGMDSSEISQYIKLDENPSANLLSGFDVSNNTIDLSKTAYSNFCKREGGDFSDSIPLTSPGNVDLMVKNNDKFSSCLIDLGNKEKARDLYEQLKNSNTRDNASKVALIADLYMDGTLDGNGLRTYITNIELKVKNSEGKEITYSEKK